MTGIERLRKEAMRWLALYDIESHGLLKIADQIEKEMLQRPRFEDGEPVQVGDKYVDKCGNVATADTVVVSNHGFTLYDRGSATHFKLTESVKRPEPPDSWERVEADVDSGKGYAGMDKADAMADVLRRCKTLAGVE